MYTTIMSTQQYQIETRIIEKSEAKILYITQSSYDKEWNSTLHTHQCTEMFYVTKGKGYFKLDNKTISVKADDMIIVNPMISHTEQGIKGETFEYIVMGVDGLVFYGPNATNKRYFISNYIDYKHEVLFYLKTLLIEARNKEDGYQEMCQCLLEALIINLIRRSNAKMEVAQASQSNQLCVLIEKYIDEHFKEDITLDTLAQVTYLSKYHIAHAFKEYKGVPPITYVLQKRIEESKMLLTNTNLQISEIGSIVGFSSLSYFTQSFKRYTNMSPVQYRKTHHT